VVSNLPPSKSASSARSVTHVHDKHRSDRQLALCGPDDLLPHYQRQAAWCATPIFASGLCYPTCQLVPGAAPCVRAPRQPVPGSTTLIRELGAQDEWMWVAWGVAHA
jgi:hypothetical protein